MNCHFPQNDLARAEAQYIVNTDNQYIVPTDGSPLRGLIQDHVVGGVMLTKRDTFLRKWEFQQLLYAALSSLPGLELIRSDADVELPPPAIMKPVERWTGKQVITALLKHLSMGHDRDTTKTCQLPGLSMERKAKTPESAFGAVHGEHLVLIRDGELLRGVLDKSAFGHTDFSLVHCVYEAYGPEKAGMLLGAFGRLFTAFIQYYAGHSCRVEDLILTSTADNERRTMVQRAYNMGARAAKAWADSEGGKIPIPPIDEKRYADQPLKPVEEASAAAKIGELLSGNEGKENHAALDGYMQGQLNPLSSGIVKKSLPMGLAVPFPYNTFGVMTTTGAKGSIVNQSQVTCALGQQALEGRRVPRMCSGRTLPSFAPYDPNPRADGFVMDRFLTGVRPQEYYFHCMAGREGLVDTAVKTSRSGYLQRCLVKHLEELKICYDYTVRNSEGAVVQFVYGEDGLDPTKAAFLDCSSRALEFMARNSSAMKRHSPSLPSSTVDIAAADARKASRVEKVSCMDGWERGTYVRARRLRSGNEWKRGRLLKGWHAAVVSKVRKHTVDIKYISDGKVAQKVPVTLDMGRCGGNNENALSSTATLIQSATEDPILSDSRRGHRLGSSGACVSERVASAAAAALKKEGMDRILSTSRLKQGEFSALVGAKYSNALCAPGEAVGSIAAQSIGEPSTQMTLNTFHLAGAGANVTLGIPRMREIIMTASREPKTPTMTVPLLPFVTEKQAKRLTMDFTRLSLMQLISGDCGISVTERLECIGGSWERAYYVSMKMHPAERIDDAFGLSLHDIAKRVAKSCVPLLSQYMKAELKRASVVGDGGIVEVSGGASSEYVENEDGGDIDIGDEDPPSRTAKTTATANLDDDENEMDDDDAPGEEDGVETSKYRRRKESVSYEEDEVNESTDDDDVDETNDDVTDTKPTEKQAALSTSKKSSAGTPSKQLIDTTTVSVNSTINSISLPPLRVDPSTRPLLMVGLMERAAENTLVHAKKNIQEAYINDEKGRGRCLQTAGVNFEEIWQLETVNHNLLLSNDIWAVRCAYGVEAARSTIVAQISGVFGAYGIEVDPRHLSLIADYATFDGGYKAMNRIGMEGSSSTLLQMSFETTVHFLKQAAVMNRNDELASPSANIVLGRPIKHGTGVFSLLART